LIEEPEHIRQSIEVILTTPQGTRIMRHGFGLDVLDPETGKPKAGVTEEEVTRSARSALDADEPRIIVDDITPEFRSGTLTAIKVSYREKESGQLSEVVVRYDEQQAE